MGLVLLWQETHGKDDLSLCYIKTLQGNSHLQARMKVPQKDPTSCWHPDLKLPASITGRNAFCLSHQVCGICYISPVWLRQLGKWWVTLRYLKSYLWKKGLTYSVWTKEIRNKYICNRGCQRRNWLSQRVLRSPSLEAECFQGLITLERISALSAGWIRLSKIPPTLESL